MENKIINEENLLNEEFDYYISAPNTKKAIKAASVLADKYNSIEHKFYLFCCYFTHNLDNFKKEYIEDINNSEDEKMILGYFRYLLGSKKYEEALIKCNSIKSKHLDLYFILKTLYYTETKNNDDLFTLINEAYIIETPSIKDVLSIAFQYFHKFKIYDMGFKVLMLMEKKDMVDYYPYISKYYKDGHGVDKDDNNYFKYLLKSPPQYKCFSLGMLFIMGKIVPTNEEKAAFYFKKALDFKDYRAPLFLFLVYSKRESKLFNLTEANKYLKLYFKSNVNNPKNQELINEMFYQLDDNFRSLFKSLARKYWDKELLIN